MATVATYVGNIKSPHWTDYEPLVVNCVTNDAAEIDRVLQHIPLEEWEMLKSGLSQLPPKPKAGLLIMLAGAESD